MDALDQLIGPADDLLSRVDSLLTRSGAPADHPLWPLLRRLGVLPGDAVSAVAAVRPAALAAVGPVLGGLTEEYAELSFPDTGGWQGSAAEAYATRSASLAAQVTGGATALAETARWADAVADWAGRMRLAVARTLALVLTSAEAVAVVTEAADAVPAAADIAARVLQTVADAYAEAEDLVTNWSYLRDEAPAESPATTAPNVMPSAIKAEWG